jgi:hypothetical protein
MAQKSGMTILLDGRIGQEAYTSVSGSTDALQRFAHDVRASLLRRPRGRSRAACSRSVNPLVTARMRERIAAAVYGGVGATRSGRAAQSAQSARRRAGPTRHRHAVTS